MWHNKPLPLSQVVMRCDGASCDDTSCGVEVERKTFDWAIALIAALCIYLPRVHCGDVFPVFTNPNMRPHNAKLQTFAMPRFVAHGIFDLLSGMRHNRVYSANSLTRWLRTHTHTRKTCATLFHSVQCSVFCSSERLAVETTGFFRGMSCQWHITAGWLQSKERRSRSREE